MTPLCKVEKEFAVMGLMESRDGKLSDNYGRWTKGIFKNYNPYNATHNPKHNNAHNELSHPTGVYNPTNTIYSPMTNTSSPRYSKNLFEMLSYLRCQ